MCERPAARGRRPGGREAGRPEVQGPEAVRPEARRLEAGRPEIQRLEARRPEIQRPESMWGQRRALLKVKDLECCARGAQGRPGRADGRAVGGPSGAV